MTSQRHAARAAAPPCQASSAATHASNGSSTTELPSGDSQCQFQCTRFVSGGAQLALVFQEPTVGFGDALAQRDAGLPAQAVQAADVQQLARGAVGLGGVVDDRAVEAGDL